MAESRGMDIKRSNDGSLLFNVALFDASGIPITTAANLNILHFVPTTGDIETYDFTDNTFKTTAVTTFNQAMTHEQADNNTVDTGIHRHRHATLTGFTIGDKYVGRVTHADLPAPVIVEFQYGDLEGDDALALGGLIRERELAQAGAAGSITLNTNADAVNDDFYNDQIVVVIAGLGAIQARTIATYTAATRIATVAPDWTVNPNATSEYIILPSGAISASGLTLAAIADAVWDEGIVAAHGTADTAGLLLRALAAVISQRSNNATLDALLGVPDVAANTIAETILDENVTTHVAASSVGAAIDAVGTAIDGRTNNSNLNALLGVADTVSTNLADAIWEEDTSTHATVASAGLLLTVLGGAIATRSFNATLNDLLGVPDTAATDTVAGQVWEETTAGHNTGGSMGEVMNNIVAAAFPSIAAIADGVWNEDIVAAHGTVDTAGLLLRVLGAALSQRANNPTLEALLGVPDAVGANIAETLWDEDITAHSTASTAGLALDALGTVIAARTNNSNLNALLGVADTVGRNVADEMWDEVLDGAHVVANSGAERLKAIDDLTQAGGAGDLADTNVQVQKLDSAALSGTPAADSVADKLDDLAAAVTILDRDLLISVNLEGVNLHIEVAVEQFGVIQTSPWVDAAAQIYNDGGALIHNIGIGDFGAINGRGFFAFDVVGHSIVAGNTYQISVEITDGAALSLSTTKPFKVIQSS